MKPIVEARLRCEDDKQDGIKDIANAVTVRARAGAQADTTEKHYGIFILRPDTRILDPFTIAS